MSPLTRARSLNRDDHPAPRLQVALLGPVRAWDVDGREIVFSTRKVRALLGFLLMASGRPVSRARLAGLLWERSGEAEARASLRQAVLELSRAFGEIPLVLRDGESLRANPGCAEVDVLTFFEGAGPACHAVPPPLMDGLEGIGDAFGDWLLAERETVLARLRDRQGAKLAGLVGDPARREEAIEAARRLVTLDPTHEAGWRALMGLLAEAGNRAQALAEYERCRAALRRALEVEPAPETRDLAARLRASSARPAILPPQVSSRPDRRLQVGVTVARPLGLEVHPLAAAYAHDTALELVRYRHFDVLHPAALEGVGPRSTEAFRALGLDYVVTVAIRSNGEGSRLLLSLMDVSELARPVWSGHALLDPGSGEVDGEALGRLVARLEPVILHTEGTRPVPKRATDASEIVIRAIPLLFSMEGTRFRRAGEM
ncbi:MAG TPA: BTAD domain-containing putative transcriptional regulator, partial [Roseomonas sp.]